METDLAIMNRKLKQSDVDPSVINQLAKFSETLKKIKNIPSRGLLPESIEQDPDPIAFYEHLKRIVSDVVKDKNEVEVEFKLGDHIRVAEIHEPMLELAIEKLITNSMQAMDFAGQIKIVDRSLSNQLIFDIQDNGPGIPQNQLDKFLVEWVEKEDGANGSGIGAMMAKYVFEKYGGSLYLNRSDASGTVLTAQLPLFSGPLDRLSA